MTPQAPRDVQFEALRRALDTEGADPAALLIDLHRYAASLSSRNLWIDLVPEAHVLQQLNDALTRRRDGATLPLLGIPFAVKDNIDVAGRPTTAACPAFAYVPTRSATCVERLQAAGAIVFGKTNLDQFATGLVGSRSPYGACASVFDDRYISGGSSSGSALAVALGCVTFALGTDTAGSGRVPAAFNNIVGLKPTRGVVSTHGVVPACRSLDCVSVFTGNVADAERVLAIAGGFDPADPYSRHAQPDSGAVGAHFRFGTPRAADLRFDGDEESERLFANARAALQALGGEAVELDFSLFRQTAELLYSGPWVAERTASVGDFIRQHPNQVNETVASIVRSGESWTAVACFEAQYKLAALRQRIAETFEGIDVLVVPTTATQYTLDQISKQPVEFNSRLGWYTNFTNLLDLCGVAVPAGFKGNGLPFGITVLGPALTDHTVCSIAARYHSLAHDQQGGRVGATPFAVRHTRQHIPAEMTDRVSVAVVGAHLKGQPLNPQLVDLGAQFVRATRTSPRYKLYALAATQPPKPGLVRTEDAGVSLEVEVYALTPHSLGRFTQAVPAPLGIGNIELEDGSWVKGFICEPYALATATDISSFGGWRGFLAQAKPALP